jgi:hypothetical protein
MSMRAMLGWGDSTSMRSSREAGEGMGEAAGPAAQLT